MIYLAIACRFVIGAVFITSAVSKLRGRSAFADFMRSLRGMNLLPPGLVKATAGVVVLAEAAVPLLLAIPSRMPVVAGFGAAAVLLTAFGAAILISLRRGRRVPCRCFGASSTPMGPQHVIRNGLLLGVAALGMITSQAGGRIGLGEFLIAAVAGLAVAGLTIASDDIVALFRSPSPTDLRRP